VPAAKQDLRQQLLRRRAAIAEADRAAAAAAVQRQVVDSSEWRRAGAVLAYAANGSELSTEALLIKGLELGKRVILPRVNADGELALHAVDYLGQLVPGYRQIREPHPGLPRVGIEEVDLALIPGVGFDRHGGRLGYGGGYYDRLLADCAWRCPIWGVAFECQVLDRLPTEDHDRPVAAVVTEVRILRVDG
jgi:5-formyltetrahydrofolate cyclo-ligase